MMLPKTGSQKRIIRWALVVFPAPERPTTATVCPEPILNDTSASACGSPSEYAKATS